MWLNVYRMSDSLLAEFLILSCIAFLLATFQIVAMLDWYHNRLQNYGYKH